MKKAFLSAALALAVAGSWAFYPSAAEPGGYMMVIGRTSPASILTITATGDTTVQAINVKRKDFGTEIHKAELHKINVLKQAGWRVSSLTTQSSTYYHENIFLLEK